MSLERFAAGLQPTDPGARRALTKVAAAASFFEVLQGHEKTALSVAANVKRTMARKTKIKAIKLPKVRSKGLSKPKLPRGSKVQLSKPARAPKAWKPKLPVPPVGLRNALVAKTKTAAGEAAFRGMLQAIRGGASAAKGAAKAGSNFAEGVRSAAGAAMPPPKASLISRIMGDRGKQAKGKLVDMRDAIREWRKKKGLVSKKTELNWDVQKDPTSSKSRGVRAFRHADDLFGISDKKKAFDKARKQGGLIAGIDASGALPAGSTVASLGVGGASKLHELAAVRKAALRKKRLKQLAIGGGAGVAGILGAKMLQKRKQQREIDPNYS